jgi:hypothetical protein
MIASLSIIGCPTALVHAPQTAATVWAGLYNNGVAVMPPTAGLVAASYGLSTYLVSGDDSDASAARRGYIAAAVLAISIVPYTILTMRPTNEVLQAVAAGTREAEATEVAVLVNRWAALNIGRSLLPLLSGAVGLFTLVRGC